MKLYTIVLGTILVSGLTVSAQENETPVTEVGLTYSFTRVNPGGSLSSYTANGGSGTFEYNVNRFVGLVADLGANYVGNVNGVLLNNTTFTYLFGPRFNWRKSRLTPYVQALVGGARLSNAFDPSSSTPVLGGSENVFATALGGGIDVRPNNHIALKPIQLEYFMAEFPSSVAKVNVVQNDLRYSAGVVFSFGSK